MRKKTEGPKTRQTTPEKGATQKRVRSIKEPSVATVAPAKQKASKKAVIRTNNRKKAAVKVGVAKKPLIRTSKTVVKKVSKKADVVKKKVVARPVSIRTVSPLLSTLDAFRKKRKTGQRLTTLDVRQAEVSAALSARAKRAAVKWAPGPIIRANKAPRITREFFERKRKEAQAKRNRKKAVKKVARGLGQWTLEQQALIPPSIKKILQAHKPRRKRSKAAKKDFLEGALMVTEKMGMGFREQMLALKHLMDTDLADWEDAIDIPVILHRLEMAMAARRFNDCLDELSGELGLTAGEIYTFWLYK
jgi:hypothetical protein